MKKKLIAALMAVAMIATLLTGCGGTGNQGGEEQAGDDGLKVIRYATISSPSGIFLPQYHNDNYNAYITWNVFEALTQVNSKGETEGRLAKSWDISEDGKTYTFHLNEGVTWHDGEPFTANDVAFTYNFMAHPDFTGFDSAYISEIAGYEEMQNGTADTLSGVVVIDENTIEITTTNVYASLLNRIAGIEILAEHIWGDVDVATAPDQTEMVQNPIGTGPFKLEKGGYIPDQSVTLTANKDYWQGAPKLDQLVYVTVNAETSQGQILNGELDVLSMNTLSPDEIKIYEDAGLEIDYVQYNSYQSMLVNNQNKWLGMVEVRRALVTALDRASMVEAFLYGHGSVANTIYSNTYWAHPGDDALEYDYAYNPEKAIEMLEDVGFRYDADENKMYDPDGEAITWRLFVPTGNKAREQAGTVIKANLEAIGISIDLQTMEFATMLSILEEVDDPERYEFALSGYGMGADPDVSTLITTGGGANYASFSDDTIDTLATKAMQTADEEERAAVFTELAQEVNKKQPIIYLWNWEDGIVMNPKITIDNNIYWTAYNSHLWDIEE